jgi:hypothetical protein
MLDLRFSWQLMKRSIIWDVTACSPVYVYRNFMLVTCLAYSSSLKMEAACSFEMLVNLYWTTQHTFPEKHVLFLHGSSSRTSYRMLSSLKIKQEAGSRSSKQRGALTVCCQYSR